MMTADAAIERLCDPAAQVSAHYVISEQGCVHQLVDEADRAWHAGAGAWGDITDVNSHSIGIEIANAGPLLNMPPFAAAQMDALTELMTGILSRWPEITPERVIAHSDMAPARKFDPGPKFDWMRLARAGLSIWPDARQVDADWNQFKIAATTFGYRAPTDDAAGWDAVLDTFRLRFRPHVAGPLTKQDVGMAVDLAERFVLPAAV